MGKDPFLEGQPAHMNFYADYQRDTAETPAKDNPGLYILLSVLPQ